MEILVTPWAEHLDLDAEPFTKHPEDSDYLFPDGEVYVQLENVAELEQVAVVHSGWKPNGGMMFLYGALDLLKQYDVELTVLFTYFPYARQDDAFYPGNLNHARSILQKLETYYAVETVIGIDAHFVHRDWVSQFSYEALHAFDLIQAAVDMKDYVVVGPDLGAVERFGVLRNTNGVEGFEKERTGADTVEIAGDLDVAGRNVLVFDDIIATGGTMIAAYEALKEQGADHVAAAAVHGVLRSGIDRVTNTFDEFYLTNTVPNTDANVDIEPLIQDTLERIV